MQMLHDKLLEILDEDTRRQLNCYLYRDEEVDPFKTTDAEQIISFIQRICNKLNGDKFKKLSGN